ncbi:hypothetical protein ABTN31_19155, partial [Acinetobacter baumannii]
VSLRASDHPEFDAWRWHDYWVPLETVIEFKREVYQLALSELSRFISKTQERLERQQIAESQHQSDLDQSADKKS